MCLEFVKHKNCSYIDIIRKLIINQLKTNQIIKIMTKTKTTLGRPVNKNSVRQVRLAELATKRANGTLKLGRPVETDSVRQKRIAELDEKRSNGTLKLGRPVNKKSVRQKKLARIARLKSQGIVVKRGRPVGSGKKETKTENVVVEVKGI
tara:strand:+ start:703 stop:1152 length:450 start_codon:yes stop_codon:yes gene_type:complete